MNTEELKKKKEELEKSKEQLIANLNFVSGKIALIDELLSQEKQKEG